MPLYKKNKICHIHIPKCGGTTFEIMMIKDLKDEVSYYDANFKPKNYQDHSPQHSSYLELKDSIPDNYEVVAFVREPYERFLSEYKWRIRRGSIEKSTKQIDFAEDLFSSKDKWWDNHDKSQRYFLESGEDIIKVINIKEMNKFFKNKFGIVPKANNESPYEGLTICNSAKKLVDLYWEDDFKIIK